LNHLLPQQENVIIQTEKATIRIIPSREEMMAQTTAAMTGAGEYWQFKAYLKRLKEAVILRHYEDGRQVEYGDIADFTRKVVSARPLTLTNKNLILAYRKGLLDKRTLTAIVPLDYACFVNEKRFPKRLEIVCQASTTQGDTVFFNIVLGRLKDQQQWLEKITKTIADLTPQDKSLL
jgi:hypothetical protein